MNRLTDPNLLARTVSGTAASFAKVVLIRTALGVFAGLILYLLEIWTAEDASLVLDAPLAACVVLVMLIGVIAGPWSALVAGLTAAALSPPAIWPTFTILLACPAAAEILRRGSYPQIATAILLTPYMLAALWNPSGFNLSSSLLVGSGAVCVATLALFLVPRRWMRLKRRLRPGWRQMTFMAVVGSSVATAALLIAGREFPLHAGNEALAMGAILLTAHILSAIAALQLSRAIGSIVSNEQGRRGRAKACLPSEISLALGTLARRARRAARAERSLRTTTTHYHNSLEQCRSKLAAGVHALRRQNVIAQQQTVTLERLRREHDLVLARWNAIIDRAPEVTIIADRRGRIEYVSRAASNCLGYDLDGLIGQSVDLLAPSFQMLSHPLSIAGDTTDPSAGPRILAVQSTEAPVQCADGKNREFSITVRELTAEGMLGYAIQLRHGGTTRRGILALKRAETSMDAARQQRDAFISALSHDLRTPLHGLIATLDMLREEALSVEGKKRLQIARSAGRSLLKIANDVLDLTRIDGGSFSLDNRPFDLRHTIYQVVQESQDWARRLGLLLSADIQENIPSAFIGDPERIKQILTNLVSNALKFTSSGSVRIKASYDGYRCTIDVIDTGRGVPQDKYDTVFEPFVQDNPSSRDRIAGAGLGLAICRGLCKMMGGKISLLSSGPAGSTFRVALPLEISDEPVPDEQSQRIFRNPTGRILTVDDHAANRYVVQAMLETMKCPATIASSGAQALELVRAQSFDIILMDCCMPEMDGYETTRRLRQILPTRIPIIAMTANASEEDRQRCLEAGMDDFLPKPFGRRALNDMLCKWLEPHSKLQALALEATLATLPAVDASIFDELWKNLQWQSAHMRRISDSFIQTIRAVCASLERFDQAMLRRELHTLLGSSGMIGARRIERLAGELQMHIHAGRREEAQALQRLLEASAAEFEGEFVARQASD
ncbi:hypothetical protein ACG33_07500 [Steroidobacter denitrificans]|uniref:histidine kinase n=1 Tax=Steroidobacter denitrificans TaxID=465721 RepID=A0A127F958_STEDE|nr:response regulator [Steroidobacter denitrificans]AMN46943.1 hypothetical protein ACG33_07500 [Steroidobacter denitrificans]